MRRKKTNFGDLGESPVMSVFTKRPESNLLKCSTAPEEIPAIKFNDDLAESNLSVGDETESILGEETEEIDESNEKVLQENVAKAPMTDYSRGGKLSIKHPRLNCLAKTAEMSPLFLTGCSSVGADPDGLFYRATSSPIAPVNKLLMKLKPKIPASSPIIPTGEINQNSTPNECDSGFVFSANEDSALGFKDISAIERRDSTASMIKNKENIPVSEAFKDISAIEKRDLTNSIVKNVENIPVSEVTPHSISAIRDVAMDSYVNNSNVASLANASKVICNANTSNVTSLANTSKVISNTSNVLCSQNACSISSQSNEELKPELFNAPLQYRNKKRSLDTKTDFSNPSKRAHFSSDPIVSIINKSKDEFSSNFSPNLKDTSTAELQSSRNSSQNSSLTSLFSGVVVDTASFGNNIRNTSKNKDNIKNNKVNIQNTCLKEESIKSSRENVKNGDNMMASNRSWHNDDDDALMASPATPLVSPRVSATSSQEINKQLTPLARPNKLTRTRSGTRWENNEDTLTIFLYIS